ncbi:carbohydrate esterase family 1 protein, partial [Polychaeton citri CBS 116435]
ASTGCGNPLPSGIKAGGTVQTLSFTDPHGYVRNYLMRVPSSYDPNKAAPLILSFHGQGGTGSSHAQESLWHNEVWNPFSIIVYPSAINGTWESNPNYYPVTSTVQPYDREFVTALLNYMQSTFCIDTGKTFASGQSNGAGFNGVMACDSTLNTRFAAFAPHCGAFYTTTPDSQCSGNVPNTVLTNNLVFDTCNPGRQVPILEIHGDNDGTIGYFGGPRKYYCLPALPHWVSDWAVRNNLGTSNVTTQNAFGNPLVTMYEFGSGTSLGYVTHYRLANWTHNWSLIQNGGPIDSTPLIMNFFYRQT